MYKIINELAFNKPCAILRISDGTQIPFAVDNSDYQKIVRDVALKGLSVFPEDTVPEQIQTAADAFLFQRQLSQYETAINRLSKYQLSEGSPEKTIQVYTGESVWNPDTGIIEHVMVDSLISAVEPLPAKITITDPENGVSEVDNPEIVKDQEERAAAQAIIAATPPDVVTAYENSLKT
jgi:hypothetical protein